MKWTFGIQNKVKISIALLLLVAAVMFSNYRLRKLSRQVGESVQTIYEDRLVVQDLIYSYSQLVTHMDESAAGQAGGFDRKKLVIAVKALNTQYLKTVLTEEEARVYSSFKEKLDVVLAAETAPSTSAILAMEHDLNRLSEIQMEEAKAQMELIQQISGSQKTTFYMESVIMIILLVIIQVLLLSSTSIQRALRKDTPHTLN